VGEGGLGSFHIAQSPGEYVGFSHISKIVFFVPSCIAAGHVIENVLWVVIVRLIVLIN